MSLHNWILNFEKITELPLPSSPTSVLPAPCLRRHAVRRRRHLAAHASQPDPNRPRAPTVCPLAIPSGCTGERHAPPPTPLRDTPPTASRSPPPHRRLPWPGLPQAAASQLTLPLLPFLFKALQPSTRTPRAPRPPLPWLPSSARRGAPLSGHSLPKPTP